MAVKSPIQRQIRFDGRRWTIHCVPGKHPKLVDSETGDPLLGICFGWDFEVYISNDQTEQSKRDTFFHELAHGVYHTAPMPEDEEQEENTVRFATKALWVIVDALDKKTFCWLFEEQLERHKLI